MSTNPNNAIGTNGAYGGRTSVEAFNDVLNTFTGAGILSGWECSPSSGMTVALGGVTGYRDVAIATAPGGAKTTINNRTSSAVEVTLDTAPSSNSRIDVIVAYVANPPQGSSSTVDNPGACGIIAVKGTVAASPSAPSDSAIRTAITADGAAGSTAYYVVLATISVVANVTTITGNYITQGTSAKMASDKLDWTTIKDDANDLPVATYTIADSVLPNIRLFRVGNLVIANYYYVSPASGLSFAGQEFATLSGTCPSGYRPIVDATVSVSLGRAPSATIKNITYLIQTDGTVKWSSEGISTSQQCRGSVTGMWITNDNWPS